MSSNVEFLEPARPAGRRPARARMVIAALVLGLLAPLIAVAGPAQAGSLHRSLKERNIARHIKHMINHERRAHGLPKVHYNHDLVAAAHRHNLTMARYDAMAHRLPSEKGFAGRIDQAGYHWVWAGENVAWNATMTRRGVSVLEKIMYNERAPYNGHRRNILNSHFRDVGVDVYLDWAHHKVWLTTDFGRR